VFYSKARIRAIKLPHLTTVLAELIGKQKQLISWKNRSSKSEKKKRIFL